MAPAFGRGRGGWVRGFHRGPAGWSQCPGRVWSCRRCGRDWPPSPGAGRLQTSASPVGGPVEAAGASPCLPARPRCCAFLPGLEESWPLCSSHMDRKAETGGEGASGGRLPAGLAPRVSLLLSLFSREISDSTASAHSPQGGSGQEQPRPTSATAHASPVSHSLRQIPDIPSHAAGIRIPMLSGWECLQAVQLGCFRLCEVSVWERGGASP